MNPPPPLIPLSPLSRDQRKVDLDHLNLLSIFHFIGAGLAVLGLMFLCAHYFFFHEILTNPRFLAHQNQNQNLPPAELFAIFKWFYLIGGLWLVGSALLNLLSGIFLRVRKYRMFSMIVGAVNCLHIPLGTVLGVFTINVLIRDSVRELYEAAPRSGTPRF